MPYFVLGQPDALVPEGVPGILRIGVRLAGDVEAQLMLPPVTKIDPFIGVLVTGKGFFDWPPPNRDRHHGITEIEVAAGEGKVALRIVGRVADKRPAPLHLRATSPISRTLTPLRPSVTTS